jgi:hypothetical protein
MAFVAVEGCQARSTVAAPPCCVEGVDVDSLRSPDACMSQPRRDLLDVPALRDQGARVRVTQSVEGGGGLDDRPISVFDWAKVRALYRTR